MALVLAGGALALAVITVVFAVLLLRKTADLEAANAALVSTDAALAGQAKAAEERALRRIGETGAGLEARIAKVAAQAADLGAGLQAANAALADAAAALGDQSRTAEERAFRMIAETRAALDIAIDSVTAEATETADGLSAHINAAQNEAARALDVLRSRMEAGNAAVVAEVAAIIDHQKEFLRSDLEARIAQREG